MKLLLIILLMSISTVPAYGDLFEKPQSSLFNDHTKLETDEDIDAELEKLLSSPKTFLTIEQAYQLSTKVTSEQLLLTWHIAPDYYLYDEAFVFTENTRQGQRKLEGHRPPGKVSFDINFNKDVAKHYQQVSVSIDRPAFSSEISSQLLLTSQGCADAGLCFPPEVDYLTIDWQEATVTISKEPFSTPFSYTEILLMAGYALLGGLILNLMPCVFPVLSLKALSIVNTPTTAQQRRHGISYTLGTVISFGLMGALLVTFRSAGNDSGWGAQLQSPLLITLLVFLFVVMGLCLSGFIHFTSRFMGIGHTLTHGTGTRQSFFTGALAAVVASPCLGPFLGVAVGFAFTQSTASALLIFMSMGFGMALPFLLISFWPKLGACLPQPGQWMDNFKQALAFPLYLTAIWLLWVLGRQLSNDAVIIVLLGIVAIVFYGWLARLKTSYSWLCIALGLITTLLIANNIQSFKNNSTTWEKYDPQTLAQYRASGTPVFINLTAAWCVTCLANEAVVFTDERLENLKARGIILIKGDLTSPNPDVSALLNQYNRAGVPLYLLYPPKSNQAPEILPQILTPGNFDNAIDKLNLSLPIPLKTKKATNSVKQ